MRMALVIIGTAFVTSAIWLGTTAATGFGATATRVYTVHSGDTVRVAGTGITCGVGGGVVVCKKPGAAVAVWVSQQAVKLFMSPGMKVASFNWRGHSLSRG
jgi:hypothetical protein